MPKSVNKARDREKPRKRINESEKIRALQDPLACIKAHRHPPIRGKLGETNRRERERNEDKAAVKREEDYRRIHLSGEEQ